jgi:tetratricopeptide (TPR) repeat protein
MKLRLIALLPLLAASVSASEASAAAAHATAEPAAQTDAHVESSATTPAAQHTASPAFAQEPELTPARAEEILSLLRIGRTKLDQGDFTSSEIAYRQVLAENATRQQDAEALTGLGRTYRKKGDYTKASAVYEKFLKEFPEDPSLPIIYLELGRSLRALGAYKQAIGRFYSVINSTLKLPETGPDLYRQLARTAQFEIAETYFQSGDYTQANRFFSRLKLLDLAPEDRARAHFKSAYALTLNGEDKAAAAAFRSFLDQNPTDENVPEARFHLSDSLRRQGQINESLLVALDLLRAESSYTEKDPKRWAYWQRKTGNQLANEFYERGDFSSALLIYQTLAKLSSEPTWALPVTYQIGLCLERLQRFDRARESYQTIVDNVKPGTADGATRPELADLAEMAAWRLNQLAWLQDADKQLSQFFSHGPVPSSTSASAQAPSKVPAHDVNGSSPSSPKPL